MLEEFGGKGFGSESDFQNCAGVREVREIRIWGR